jgi:tripartite-type tricarboxylate transporter receptor subunit TctC
VVGYPAGAGADPLARIVAPRLSAALGREVRIENRPGAGTTNAAHFVALAPADGHTLLFADTALVAAPSLYAGLRFDPLRSFAPVGGALSQRLALVAHPEFKARSAAELVSLAKADPGRIAYGSPGTGTPQQLAMEDFERREGLSLVHIPYPGSAALIPGVVWGQVQIAITSAEQAIAAARDGGVNALFLEGASVRYFLVAPAGTPATAIDKLSSALKTALSSLDVPGAPADWTTPGELAARLEKEVPSWAAVARHAGIRATLP